MNPVISMILYLSLIGILTIIAIVIFGTVHHVYLRFDGRQQLGIVSREALSKISNPVFIGLRYICVVGIGNDGDVINRESSIIRDNISGSDHEEDSYNIDVYF